MPQIGHFTLSNGAFVGRIQTLLLGYPLTIVPADSTDAEKAPDYRVLHGGEDGVEVGAGWKEVGEKAGNYVSLIIDDPSLTQPIRAKLFQSAADSVLWTLHWSRPKPRAERA